MSIFERRSAIALVLVFAPMHVAGTYITARIDLTGGLYTAAACIFVWLIVLCLVRLEANRSKNRRKFPSAWMRTPAEWERERQRVALAMRRSQAMERKQP